MNRFQTLLSISTCAATPRWERNGWQGKPMKHVSIDFANFWSTAELLKKELGVETVSGDDYHFMLGLTVIHF
jgi:hypothetical protein